MLDEESFQEVCVDDLLAIKEFNNEFESIGSFMLLHHFMVDLCYTCYKISQLFQRGYVWGGGGG